MRSWPVALAMIAITVAGCSGWQVPVDATASSASPTTIATTPDTPTPLATDPARLADDLVADHDVLRDPSATEAVLVAAARRQQATYRAIGRHPEWDALTRSRIPQPLLEAYDLNVDARRQLTAIAPVSDTLPAWRIDAPVPVDELLRDYRDAEAATGVDWNYLAAINLIETHFGSVIGLSTAGAQGPMQFLPSTFDAYGEGGDIDSPRDSIMAAGRYLAANGFARDRDHAVYRYNHADEYVRAVADYATVLAADPAALADYHRWDVYYFTTAGDVVLPIGYAAAARIPVGDYLATHGQ